MDSFREQLFKFVKEKYDVSPEYLWMKFPGYAVFRHSDNNKWFGAVMNIPKNRLGLKDEEQVDILNVRMSDPLMADLLIKQPGYFKGYHFGGRNWVSILLDGTVPFIDICRYLQESFTATASKEKKKASRPSKEWIIPANPKYYDIEHAFDGRDEIDWKQGSGIKKGDTVFLYAAAPVSAILYKCSVTETDIPYNYTDGDLTIRALMKIKLQKRYRPDMFTFKVLKERYGIFAVRGPRGIPGSLSEELKR